LQQRELQRHNVAALQQRELQRHSAAATERWSIAAATRALQQQLRCNIVAAKATQRCNIVAAKATQRCNIVAAKATQRCNIVAAKATQRCKRPRYHRYNLRSFDVRPLNFRSISVGLSCVLPTSPRTSSSYVTADVIVLPSCALPVLRPASVTTNVTTNVIVLCPAYVTVDFTVDVIVLSSYALSSYRTAVLCPPFCALWSCIVCCGVLQPILLHYDVPPSCD
jgi:hypothetical protein